MSLGWIFTKVWRATCGGIWIFMLIAFVIFFFQWMRYYYYGKLQSDIRFESTYRDVSKIARQIVLGFLIFLCFTYVICLSHYDEFVDGMFLGVLFNIAMCPIYYKYFGDSNEFKFKTI